MRAPYLFDEFFAAGRSEVISPFLTPTSRPWGKNVPLKSACLAAALLAGSFSLSFFHLPLSHLLLALVYFLAGTPALIGAIEDMKNLEINIDVLMTLAALLSVAIGSALEGALLLVLFELSAAMEESVNQKTRKNLLDLNRLSPRSGCVIDDEGTLFERSVHDIAVGTHLLIKAGETVPLDGTVIGGSSFVNLAHLTGEGEPISKQVGNDVPAGAYNMDGTLTIRVTRTSSDSTLSRIIQLITQAQEAKPKLEKLLDQFGKWYALSIMGLSALFALSLPWLLGIPYLGIEGGVYRALTFLVAASPCALIIATPTAYLSAISSCSRRGILLKGGIVLDAVASARAIAFDKTGTLTTGDLVCDAIVPLSPSPLYTIDEALALAAALERNAIHPIAKAICTQASEKQLSLPSLSHFKAIAGSGLEAIVQKGEKEIPIAIGHRDFISQKKATALLPKTEGMHAFLLVGEDLFAFHFSDQLREQMGTLIHELKQRHLRLIMLTGDTKENAAKVAEQLGLDEAFADLRPEDKLVKVASLAHKEGLIMVGDGVNDAPALARASVGISLGKIGSATAVDASDIVFLKDDLRLLNWLIGKAHETRRIVLQNLSLALAVILCATTPALLGIVPLWIAVLLHEGGTVLVGLNSLRLLR